MVGYGKVSILNAKRWVCTFPLRLSDTGGLELPFQDLFHSSHFKASLSSNKQTRLRKVFWEKERVELKKKACSHSKHN